MPLLSLVNAHLTGSVASSVGYSYILIGAFEMEEMLLQQAIYSEIPMEQYCLKFPGMEQVYCLVYSLVYIAFWFWTDLTSSSGFHLSCIFILSSQF